MIDNLSQPITRSDIIGLRAPNPVVRRRRVAIASLMWGYGITGTRWGSWVTDYSRLPSCCIRRNFAHFQLQPLVEPQPSQT